MQKKKEDKKIKDQRVFDLLDEIKAAYEAAGQVVEGQVVEKMQALRNVFIELEQPTLVKSLRLVYEYAAEFEEFAIEPWEEEGGLGSFLYYLGLLGNPFNKYNRDEIKELNNYLKARLAGEEVEFKLPAEDEDED